VKDQTNTVGVMLEWQQIAVGAAVVAKMYPNYALFCELSGFASAAKFSAILDLVWECAGGVNHKIDFSKQLTKLEQLTPDSDSYDMYGVWPALDAATAMNSLLSACDKWDPDEISSVIILSNSTISSYLEFIAEQEKDTDSRLQAVDKSDPAEGTGDEVDFDDTPIHELFEEQDRYLELVSDKLLKDSESLGRRAAVNALRQFSRHIGLSNIGLSL